MTYRHRPPLQRRASRAFPLSCCPAVLLSCCPAVLLSCCPAVLLSCCPAFLLSCCPAFPLYPLHHHDRSRYAPTLR
ncbi:hypothetical protein DF053_20330 [Burkholderia cepacia]|nr:hypothetical protein DF053_20330 [Burkholderia cepacia]